jgi:hypothetical protein
MIGSPFLSNSSPKLSVCGAANSSMGLVGQNPTGLQLELGGEEWRQDQTNRARNEKANESIFAQNQRNSYSITRPVMSLTANSMLRSAVLLGVAVGGSSHGHALE